MLQRRQVRHGERQQGLLRRQDVRTSASRCVSNSSPRSHGGNQFSLLLSVFSAVITKLHVSSARWYSHGRSPIPEHTMRFRLVLFFFLAATIAFAQAKPQSSSPSITYLRCGTLYDGKSAIG